MQYITNEQGQRVGVLLDLATYQQLAQALDPDPEPLINVSRDELVALAESALAPETQTHLHHLLALNTANQLPPAEATELDQLLTRIDQLNILKTLARYTLGQVLQILKRLAGDIGANTVD